MNSAASSVLSHDLAEAVDPVGLCTATARHVEGGVAAIHVQHETVDCRVRVITHDLARVVDPKGIRSRRAGN